MLKLIFNNFAKTIIIILVLTLTLFPLYYLIISSLISPQLAASGNPYFLPDGFYFENFKEAINDNLRKALEVTVPLVLLVICVRLFSFTLAAYGLTFATQKFRKAVFIFLLLVSLIPENSLYFYLRVILSTNGFINENIIFSLAVNLFFSYFLFLITYQAFKNVGLEHKKIAHIDNLTKLEKFRFLFFPQLKVPLLLIIIFSTIQVWNDALWPQLILGNTSFENIFTWFQKLNLANAGIGVFTQVQAAGSAFAIFIPLLIYGLSSWKLNQHLYQNL